MYILHLLLGSNRLQCYFTGRSQIHFNPAQMQYIRMQQIQQLQQQQQQQQQSQGQQQAQQQTAQQQQAGQQPAQTTAEQAQQQVQQQAQQATAQPTEFTFTSGGQVTKEQRLNLLNLEADSHYHIFYRGRQV